MGATRARGVVLDSGALIEFEKGNARIRALVREAEQTSAVLTIPVGALAQAWRDGSRQARLAALVKSRTSDVALLDEPAAKAAGVLCGRAGTSDVIDASVVLTARERGVGVVTVDPDDLRRLDPDLEIHAL